MTALSRRVLPALGALVLAACAPSHVAPYVPKQRAVPVPETPALGGEATSAGSLWREGAFASNLYTDARALRENDLVVVKVEEIADAQRSSDTDLLRQGQFDASINAFVNASQNSAGLVGKGDTRFKGLGSTARTERLTATVPAVVRKVLPNGNLFIEGHRVVLVNSEEQHFYISGVVRPIDIDQENSVKSSMVAEAEVEFTGRGVLTDNQRQGVLSRFIGWFWPF